jgi:hypothetical protein
MKTPVATKTTTRKTKQPVVEPVTTAAPVETPTKPSASRRIAAFKAHKTMLERKLKGSRGKPRAELLAKIAEFDRQIAAA